MAYLTSIARPAITFHAMLAGSSRWSWRRPRPANDAPTLLSITLITGVFGLYVGGLPWSATAAGSGG
jgi:hypothetical protein